MGIRFFLGISWRFNGDNMIFLGLSCWNFWRHHLRFDGDRTFLGLAMVETGFHRDFS